MIRPAGGPQPSGPPFLPADANGDVPAANAATFPPYRGYRTMRFRASRLAPPEPKRWLVYLETPFRADVVEFKDYVQAVLYAQERRTLGKVLSIEVSDALGRVVWSHTQPA